MTKTLTASRINAARATLCLWLSSIVLLLFCTQPSLAQFSDRYDDDIRSATRSYWPDLPYWRLWKSQLEAESRLDPSVCSAAGACGLAQFMPATFEDVSAKLGYRGVSRFDAKISIDAGAYYMAKLRGGWKTDGRTAFDRNDLAMCSYNRGAFNCIADQTECGGALLWLGIEPCTSRHTLETPAYIRRINGYFKMMQAAP